jgi:glucose-1-phosphate adenylyltransferase
MSFQDVKNKDVEDVIILSGDHLYRMDYLEFVQKHKDTDADITVSCVPMDDSCASEYALVKIDNKGKVLHFNEKSECKSLTSMVCLHCRCTCRRESYAICSQIVIGESMIFT